jgi:hypothetical protein
VEQEPQWGLIPRAGRYIFEEIAAQRSRDPDGVAAFTEYRVSCSYLELYNEKLFDLLSRGHGEEVRRGKNNRGLDIRQDKATQGVFVPGAAQIVIENEHDLLSLLWEGARHRAVAATNMNEHSSRSHTILQVTIERRPREGVDLSKLPTGREELARVLRAKLNLVDLAGSETMKHHTMARKQFTNQRIAELTSINQSLSSLGNCIRALEKGAKHVPYRDSKLTRLLQDSLGGNTKTSFVVTVSPSDLARGETLSTLQFADRAKRVVVHAYANEELASGDELVKANHEIVRLREMMKNMVTAMNAGGSGGSGGGGLGSGGGGGGGGSARDSGASASAMSSTRFEDLHSLEVQLLAEQKRRCEVEAELTVCRKQYLAVLGANKGRGSVKPLVEKVRRAGGGRKDSDGDARKTNISGSAYKKSLSRQRSWNETYLDWLRRCPGVVVDGAGGGGGGGRKITRPDQLTAKQARALTAQQRLVLAEWSVLLQSEDLEMAKHGLLEEREKIRQHANRIRSQFEEEEKQQRQRQRKQQQQQQQQQKQQAGQEEDYEFALREEDFERQGVYDELERADEVAQVGVQERDYSPPQQRIWHRPTPQQRERDDEELLVVARATAAIESPEMRVLSPEAPGTSPSQMETLPAAINFAGTNEASSTRRAPESIERAMRVAEKAEAVAVDAEKMRRLLEQVEREAIKEEEQWQEQQQDLGFDEGKLMALLQAEEEADAEDTKARRALATGQQPQQQLEMEEEEVEDWKGNSQQEQNNDTANVGAAAQPAGKKSVRLWKKIFDTNTGFNYYYDRVTGETTWEKPADFASAMVPVHLHKHLVEA